MSTPHFSYPHTLVTNKAFDQAAPYTDALRHIVGLQAFEKAKRSITHWPGYAPTPLHTLDGLAKATGVARIFYKDEAPRFGLNSFKGLGGAYAVYRVLEEKIIAATGAKEIMPADIISGTYKDIVSTVTVTTATDGNHGRAVAWGARLFGCPCFIYIHTHVSEGRAREIEKYGATVIRIEGNYDDSVRQAQADARTHNRIVISDTSYEGYMDIPRHVMQGYAVMVDEALSQIPAHEKPTHVFLQGGVGAMAAGVIGHFWELWGAEHPRFIIVEPDKADCLLQSAKAGKPVVVHGALDTIMAGLACGEVSLLAWQILQPSCSHFMSITDDAAMDTMRLLAKGTGGDVPVVGGESAVGGLAGFLTAQDRASLREELGLTSDSRILIFGTEGDSDPELYTKIVGRSSESVRGSVGC